MIKLEVSTHSNHDNTDIINVEEYDASELVEKLNSNDIQSIKLGNNIYSRIDIKNVKPVDEDTE